MQLLPGAWVDAADAQVVVGQAEFLECGEVSQQLWRKGIEVVFLKIEDLKTEGQPSRQPCKLVAGNVQRLQTPQLTEGQAVDVGAVESVVAEIELDQSIGASKVMQPNVCDLVVQQHKGSNPPGQPWWDAFQPVVVHVKRVQRA